MKQHFGDKKYFLQLRMILALIVAIAVIIADSQLNIFIKIRIYIDTAISPLYFLVHRPFQRLDNLTQILAVRTKLVLENCALRQELLLKHSSKLLLGHYQQENLRLRELLGSPLQHNEKKMLTQVISNSTDPYSDQVIIDKGLDNGVYVGQPVISNKGVVGQVIATGKLTSRVLLICDKSHAIPIQVLRNDICFIVTGKGCNEDLKFEQLPGNTDINVGDMLVTSGLDGRFPEGYPVAIVSSVKVDTQRAYTMITARPIATGLQRLHYLLLVWSTSPKIEVSLLTNKVYSIANERLIKMNIPQI